MSISAAEIAKQLNAKRSGRGWQACCPAHEDSSPSLSIDEGKNGGVLLRCHAGCSFDEIAAAMQIKPSDLFADSAKPTNGGAWDLVATYAYQDADGRAVGEVRKYLVPNSQGGRQKTFLPFLPGAMKSGLQGTQLPPYRLAELLNRSDGEIVYLVEGEKDVDRLAEDGLTATTNQGGAGKWRADHNDYFRDADVVILPDNDEPGRQHATEVAKHLRGVARRIRVVELPGLPHKGDVSDWRDQGNTVEQLQALVDQAAEWTGAAPLTVEEPAGIAPEKPAADRWRFLTPTGLGTLPPPIWVVEGLIRAAGRTMVYGHPGSAKTACVLDMVLTMGSGRRSWFGRAVKPGLAVYVCTEGTSMLKARVAAWRQRNPGPEPTVLFVPDAVNLLRVEEIAAFHRHLEAELQGQPVSVIIFDTVHSNAPGLDDNLARDVGLVMESADYLIKHTGAAVVFVHHANKGTDIERGSGAWRGALDVMVYAHGAEGEQRELRLKKMRDGELWSPWAFDLLPVGESFVVTTANSGERIDARLTDAQISALATLEELTRTGAVSAAAWRKSTDIPERSFYRISANLVDLGLATKVGRGYAIADAGRDRLVALRRPVSLPCPPSKEGVAVAAVTPPTAVAVPWQQRGSGSEGEQERLSIEGEAA